MDDEKLGNISVITPEIIPNEIKRFRPIRTGDESSKYCSKEKLSKRLITEFKGNKTKFRGVDTLNKWITLLLKYDPDFHNFYTPGELLNDYVVWCLEQIHEYDMTLPQRGKGKPKLVAEFIENNIHLFSARRYQEILKNEFTKEQPIDSAKIVHVA